MNNLSYFHIFWVCHLNWRGLFPLCLAFISTLLSRLSFCFFLLHFPLPQAKVDNEILNYKDLAALPKVKSIYEVQRPDLISYEPHSRYTSDEMLERCGYGEVWGLALWGRWSRGEPMGSPGPSITETEASILVAPRLFQTGFYSQHLKIKPFLPKSGFSWKIRAGNTTPVFPPPGDGEQHPL